jgi:hypothetical protein
VTKKVGVGTKKGSEGGKKNKGWKEWRKERSWEGEKEFSQE